MQNSNYPYITNAPNTNGQSCSSVTEYVDVTSNYFSNNEFYSEKN